MSRKTRLSALLAGVVCALASGCWVVDVLKPPPEVTEEYDAAKGMFLKQEYGRAEVAFKAFIHNYPKNPLTPWARYYLAQSYRHQELFNEAIEPFSEVLSQPPSPEILPLVRYDLAECYRRTGKVNEARELYQKLVAESAAAGSETARMFAARAKMRLDELNAQPPPAPPKPEEKKPEGK